MRCACSRNRACFWWRVVKVIHIRLRHRMTVHNILCMHSICIRSAYEIMVSISSYPTKRHTNWILNACCCCCDKLLLLANVCDATIRLLSHVANVSADAACLRFKLFPQLSSSAELCGQLVSGVVVQAQWMYKHECPPSKWKDLVVAAIWWNWLQCTCIRMREITKPESSAVHPSVFKLNCLPFSHIHAQTRVLVECYSSVPIHTMKWFVEHVL